MVVVGMIHSVFQILKGQEADEYSPMYLWQKDAGVHILDRQVPLSVLLLRLQIIREQSRDRGTVRLE